ncbi:MAG: transglutaminase-like cysteine peptidase [Sphingomonadaceae bacterium]|nr:transglutaminase-like cysteine peptidase [Sphingomonadaceae bacterium]
MAQTDFIVANAATDCTIDAPAPDVRLASHISSRPAPSAGPWEQTKSAAILGGAPSKLEQMRMSQATGKPAPVPAVPLSVDAGTARNCDQSLLLPKAAADILPANAILGSLPVNVRHTPFDRDWSFASSGKDMRGINRALAASGARHADDEAARIEAVNSWVNRTIAFGDDRDIYGRADYWAPAAETFRRGTGDCEDFAIAKMELLSALGISRSKMRLVVARDHVRNADHAVLVVSLSDRSVMLDNVTDQLLDARLPNDYRPIMSFSQNAKWVHGYAVQPATPVRMASATSLPRPAANKLSEVLTVSAEPDFVPLSLALLSVPLVLPTELSARV